MGKIAFFDFDGTITTKDTLLEFIRFAHGNTKFKIGFLLNSPWLILFKIGLIKNQLAKEKILSFFFKDMSIEEFQQKSNEFAKEKIPALLRPAALKEIANLQLKGYEITIVSASPGNWIRPWAEKYGYSTIASELAISNFKLSGKIEGKNCHGQEKVNRIKKIYDIASFENIKAYGDTKGDLPMLKLANQFFYKPFRASKLE